MEGESRKGRVWRRGQLSFGSGVRGENEDEHKDP